jgi:hypothetical protein
MSDEEGEGPSLTLKEASPFMQAFWDLAAVEVEVREAAAAALLAHVRDAQSQFEDLARTAGADADAAPATGDQPNRLCRDLDYTWKRCVPGLARGAPRGNAWCLCTSKGGAEGRGGAALAAPPPPRPPSPVVLRGGPLWWREGVVRHGCAAGMPAPSAALRATQR